jgi:hypothetical protein
MVLYSDAFHDTEPSLTCAVYASVGRLADKYVAVRSTIRVKSSTRMKLENMAFKRASVAYATWMLKVVKCSVAVAGMARSMRIRDLES